MATAYVNFRFRRLRPLLEGKPIKLIEHAKLLARNLRRERMGLEERPPKRVRQQIPLDAGRIGVRI